MKKKDVAGLLAIVLGGFGIHQFYLGKKGWGIFHLVLMFSMAQSPVDFLPLSYMIAWISAIILFSMGKEEFDDKYNKKYRESDQFGGKR
ncbi:MAG: TM2 domain-containing membrane protein YozV, partial [Saprospiraceae bacterium]